MYRIIKAVKDGYITNKVISKEYSYNSNLGQAGTFDFFSLYDESVVYDITRSLVTSGVREYSRTLIEFDYSKIQELHSGYYIDISGGNYTCSLKMMDVYGGQSTPSNFVLEVLPLARQWSEGRGFDVVGYQHVDAANWLTASLSGSNVVTWSLGGAGATGSLSDANIDVYVSGNLGSGNQYLGIPAFFPRGDENFEANITILVSASLANIIPNNGFRIAFTEGEENEDKTYFVKRFGTRHVQNKDLQPRIDVTSTDDIIRSDKGRASFCPQTQSFYLLNSGINGYKNYFNGGFEITGSECILLELSHNKQVMVSTSSFSLAHNMTISYMTQALASFSASFLASQKTIGTRNVPGIYKAEILLDPYQDQILNDYLSGSFNEKVIFKAAWKNAANSQILHLEDISFDGYSGLNEEVIDKNYIMNIYNLRGVYSKQTDGCQRFRVFIQNYNTEQIAYRYAQKTKGEIVPGVRYRIKKAYQNIEYIPFCEATELSYDEDGMFFDLFVSDFESGSVYQIDLVVPTGNGSQNDLFVQNQAWRFKIID